MIQEVVTISNAPSSTRDREETRLPEPPGFSFTPRRDAGRRCGVVKSFHHKDNPRRKRLQRLDCKSWSCTDCRPKVVEKWTANTLRAIKVSEKATNSPCQIYRLEVPDCEWPALRSRLYRQTAEWVRVRVNSESSIVVTTAAVGVRIPSAKRRNILAMILDGAWTDGTGRPVSTSSGWALWHDDDDPEWVTDDVAVCGSLEDIKEMCHRDLGIQTTSYEYDGSLVALEIRIPGGAENVQRFHGWLQRGRPRGGGGT